MTEAEWFASTEPQSRLRFILGTNARVQDIYAFLACKGSPRKLRLFACACYFRIHHLLKHPLAPVAVEVAERYADGLATREELLQVASRLQVEIDALEARWRASRGEERATLYPIHGALALAWQVVRPETPKAAYYASSNAYLTVGGMSKSNVAAPAPGFEGSRSAEERIQTDLLRCIFGPLLFRPVHFAPFWHTLTVKAVAGAIYGEKAFDRLPILADALEDAGCGQQEILNHCRRPGVHVRGCWVVEALLGRE